VPAIVALVVWILVSIVTTLGSIVVYINLFIHDQSVLKYRKRDSSIPDDDQLAALPGVTILRPLKGIDNSLVDNLASSFRQRYAKFEIILSVADEDDPAIDVVRALQRKYPDVDSTLLIGKPCLTISYRRCVRCRSESKSKQPRTWIRVVEIRRYLDP
jgi:ceramide glucosyltransferase